MLNLSQLADPNLLVCVARSGPCGILVIAWLRLSGSRLTQCKSKLVATARTRLARDARMPGQFHNNSVRTNHKLYYSGVLVIRDNSNVRTVPLQGS